MNQPTAHREVVRDTYFDTTIEDPYRWMEDRQGEEFQPWIRAQAASTRAYLDRLLERQAWLSRITQLRADSPYDFQAAGGRTFSLKRDFGGNFPKLMGRLERTGVEKTLRTRAGSRRVSQLLSTGPSPRQVGAPSPRISGWSFGSLHIPVGMT